MKLLYLVLNTAPFFNKLDIFNIILYCTFSTTLYLIHYTVYILYVFKTLNILQVQFISHVHDNVPLTNLYCSKVYQNPSRLVLRGIL